MSSDFAGLEKSLDLYIKELKSIKPDGLFEIDKALNEVCASLKKVDLEKSFEPLEVHKQKLEQKKFSYKELLDWAVSLSMELELLQFHNEALKVAVDNLEKINSASELIINEQQIRYERVLEIDDVSNAVSSTINRLEGLISGRDAQKRIHAKNTADARHSKPGGSREKRLQIREIWASGKYESRDICCEQECAALGMSFSTARKALQGTPNPNPWPARNIG